MFQLKFEHRTSTAVSAGNLNHPDNQKNKLGRWCLRRQVYYLNDGMVEEAKKGGEMEAAGMQGRCNKLPDTCYSFWIGGTLQMLGDEWLNMLNKNKLLTQLPILLLL